MSHASAYYHWCRRFADRLPGLERLLLLLPVLSLDQKKALLTAARVQSYPDLCSRLYSNLKDVWNSPILIDPSYPAFALEPIRHLSPSETLLTLSYGISDYLPSSIFSGFLSSIIRSAPVASPLEYEQTRNKALLKEILASIYEYHPVNLDYRCEFSNDPRDRDLPFAPNLPSNRTIAGELHNILCSLKFVSRTLSSIICMSIL